MIRRMFLALLLTTVASGALNTIGASAQNSPTIAQSFSFVAFGDAGTGESNQLAIATAMAVYHDKHPFDTALMLGDNIYPDGNPALLKNKFERPYAELLKRGVRFYAVLGNHDARRGRQAEIEYPNFNMSGKAYYSIVKGEGLIEFFALDSVSMTRPQLSWLEGALSASKAQWKIVFFHHPIYSSGITHGSDMKLRALLEPIFVKYGVATVLAGHDHTYERTKPQQGVQYFVSGTGGQLRKGDLDRRSPIFAAGNDQVNSYMYFEATPEKLSFWALDASGHTLDNGAIALSRAVTQGK
ncbi:MAG: metallophosphoesterase [Acidobacteriota bacterium]